MAARHRNAGYFFDAKFGRALTQFGGWEMPYRYTGLRGKQSEPFAWRMRFDDLATGNAIGGKFDVEQEKPKCCSLDECSRSE